MADAKPDYERIAQLERDLGLVEEPARRPMRPDKVCLVKGCTGEVDEIYAWGSDIVLARIHRH